MISAFQRVGVKGIWLVAGSENKKAERQFSGDSVFFLHQEPAAQTVEEAVHFGLSQLPRDLDSVFLACSDMPLFLPKTLEALLQSKAPAARPVFQGEPGWPVLLRDTAAVDSLADMLQLAELITVEDPGVSAQSCSEDHLQKVPIKSPDRPLDQSHLHLAAVYKLPDHLPKENQKAASHLPAH